MLRAGYVLLISERGNLVGFVIDHHDPSLFPERWIDLAVVLTCDNGILHDRLTVRCVHVSFTLYCISLKSRYEYTVTTLPTRLPKILPRRS